MALAMQANHVVAMRIANTTNICSNEPLQSHPPSTFNLNPSYRVCIIQIRLELLTLNLIISISIRKASKMLINTSPLLALLFLKHALSAPYPFPNSTMTPPIPSTICNSTTALCNPNANLTAYNPITNGTHQNICQEVYPSDLTVLNSRYPDYNTTHLHHATQLFMLRRQLPGDGEIATRVQFDDLPASVSNLTCRLEFILPPPQLQRISGSNPSFNVYQVERAAGAVATWSTYSGNILNDATLFGTVNGEEEALNRTRSVGGVAAVNETLCNSTLTFQMGMKYNGKFLPNYWEFLNVEPPAWPVQGFRVVYGC
ncbi:hypothetical protein T440DRAFT_466837 [Plenodomus tracheiphilus IPT5]|uniref:Ubiquitin 3 binding protein But2 C-terminal domain-containing protein n=1 Tax=Plenodomus tracheiphilus IPT5 TaxID=1408161 RepID=A0A6A7BDB9_9PLEO|nr:hypothetical protein T440DRAFT_466837 [Plenodomus tracheiphilus IPT5]